MNQELMQIVAAYEAQMSEHGRVTLPITQFQLALKPNTFPIILQLGQSDSPVIMPTSFELDTAELIIYQYPLTPSQPLNLMVGAMCEVLAFYKSFDSRSINPTGAIDEAVDLFLKSHGKPAYNEITANIEFSSLVGNDFGQIWNTGQKKRLFDFRAKVYMAAISAAEKAGYNLQNLLNELDRVTIPPIKKELQEPAYNSIRNMLVR